jgi:hypothetical protein
LPPEMASTSSELWVTVGWQQDIALTAGSRWMKSAREASSISMCLPTARVLDEQWIRATNWQPCLWSFKNQECWRKRPESKHLCRWAVDSETCQRPLRSQFCPDPQH